MGIKPLGVVKTIVEAAGMGISYVYDDLVFLEHNSFLLQFTTNDREITVHVNSEEGEATVHDDIEKLQNAAGNHAMQFLRGTLYTLVPDEKETIRIEFRQ